MLFPLPFTCLHEHYSPQLDGNGDPVLDDWGNAKSEWANPVSVACFWWTPTSGRELGDESVSNEQSTADLKLVVNSTLSVDQRDRFTVEGKPFEVVGLPKDYNHGPFGFAPGRNVVELKWVG